VVRDLTEDVQSALAEIQRYLLDQIPPLTAADSIEILIQQPPQLLMRQIHAWAVEQKRVAGFPMSDLLFHALKKVHLFGNLKLLERPLVDGYLDKLTTLAMEFCPPEDRESLKTNLVAMRDSRNISVSAVDIVRPDSAAAKPVAPRGPAGDLVSRSAHRLSLVIDRLSRFLPGRSSDSTGEAPSPGAPAAPVEQPAAQLVTMAAASSTSEEELDRYIQSIRPYTGEGEASNLIRLLAGSVPAWDLVVPPEMKVKPPAPVEAMHKIISLTKNPNDSTKRFRELLTSAIEQFNAGSLSAAVSMLQLAEIVIVEKKLDASTVERVRSDAVEAISSEQLKKYAENKSKHAGLRKVLAFFPTLTHESLLQKLRGEERPERRRSLLGLLEAYGAIAREAAVAALDAELKRPEGEADTYYLRNLIYLLHRIPRQSDSGGEKEVELMTRSTARGQSIYVIKEAVLALGQIKTEAVVKLLTMRLAEFETILLRKDASIYPVDEMQKLLDRIVAALARIATPAALLTIARHGMKPNPLLGDTRGRLATLSAHDLSFDEQTVTLIVKTIRENLPSKILGRYLPKVQPPPAKLIEALSSTRSEAVEKLLDDVAQSFSDHDVGRAAAAALVNLRSTGKTVTLRDGAAVSLSGDLQFFGLPSLLQSLTDQQATGIVTLSSKQGQTAGKLLFVEGKFADAQASQLRGVDALYQMLERPIVGHFAFIPQPAANVKGKTDPIDVLPLLLEGIRRHDELKQAVALVPDHLCLKPATARPTPDPSESDPAILREVWVKASGGAPIGEWEPQIATDAYRVRRLLAHWVEEGALQPV